jgi:hypothetical protein
LSRLRHLHSNPPVSFHGRYSIFIHLAGGGRTPTRRISVLPCARMVSGHAAATPPKSVMNSRRPKGLGRMFLPGLRTAPTSYPKGVSRSGGCDPLRNKPGGPRNVCKCAGNVQVMCRFSDAGNDDLATRSGSRRPKSAKARNRGRYAPWPCGRLSYGGLSGERAACMPARGERWSDCAGRSMPAGSR